MYLETIKFTPYDIYKDNICCILVVYLLFVILSVLHETKEPEEIIFYGNGISEHRYKPIAIIGLRSTVPLFN
jgi:hypothetical protein